MKTTTDSTSTLSAALTATPSQAALDRVIPFTPAPPPPGSHTASSGSAHAQGRRRKPAHSQPEAPLPDIALGSFTAEEIRDMTLATRPAVLGGWLKQGDLGYLYAPRGAGKSWMAMLIGRAVASGAALGDWQAGDRALPVHYFDAEMNLPDVKTRLCSLGLYLTNFRLISNEILFQAHGCGVNIAAPDYQAAISQYLPDGCLFIIDNLSTSQLGMAENDNDAFDAIRDWLLGLRHRAITVLIVHHAGRNGQMRGGSRREDMAHWILSLKEASEPGKPAHRTAFSTEFVKCRNCTSDQASPLLWTLDTSTTPLTLECEGTEPHDQLLNHIRNGMSRATELAETLNLHPATISKWAAKLAKEGRIVIQGRDYLPVDTGTR